MILTACLQNKTDPAVKSSFSLSLFLHADNPPVLRSYQRIIPHTHFFFRVHLSVYSTLPSNLSYTIAYSSTFIYQTKRINQPYSTPFFLPSPSIQTPPCDSLPSSLSLSCLLLLLYPVEPSRDRVMSNRTKSTPGGTGGRTADGKGTMETDDLVLLPVLAVERNTTVNE